MKPRRLTVADLERQSSLHRQLSEARREHAELLDENAPQEPVTKAISKIAQLLKALEAMP